jgi:hypothetical protein
MLRRLKLGILLESKLATGLEEEIPSIRLLLIKIDI